MVFEVPDWKKSIEQNVFEVKISGQHFKLPKFDYITPRQSLVFDPAQLNAEPAKAFEVLDSLSSPAGLGEILMDAPVKVTMDLLDAWSTDSGVTPGESQASGS